MSHLNDYLARKCAVLLTRNASIESSTARFAQMETEAAERQVPMENLSVDVEGAIDPCTDFRNPDIDN